MATSKLYSKRVFFFNSIIKNFKHEKLSELIVAHKINKKIFKKIKKSAISYYNHSKKFSLTNLTPNGRLSPKVEIQKSFNKFIIEYFKLIESLKIEKMLKNYLPPVIRYKEKKINKINKNNNNRSELPHADSWAGWTHDYLLFLLPLAGDVKNNKVRFFHVPKNLHDNWFEKKDFIIKNKKLILGLKPIKDHYKCGYLYIADITVPHVTVRNKNSRGRLSVDSPLQFKTKNKISKYNMTNYITSNLNFISIKDAKELGKKFIFLCPYKMGEYERTTGKFSKPAFILSKKI
jgi:hypothetical protein